MAESKIIRRAGGVNVKNATATISDVVEGKTFYSGDKEVKTGTVVNRGTINQTLSINGSYTIPAGFHSGSGIISQNVTTRGASTITPGTSNQSIAANQWLTGTQTILGSANLIPENIKEGVTIFGITGNFTGSFDLLSSNPFVWYDANQITGVSNGSTISQWNDFSGGAQHITQSNSSLRPIYRTNIKNGLPVVDFDGVNDALQRTSFSQGTQQQPNTIFILANIQSLQSGNRYIFEGGNSSFRQSMTYGSSNRFIFPGCGSILSTSSGATLGWKILVASFNTSNSFYRENENTFLSGSLSSCNGWNGVTVGSYIDLSTVYAVNCQIGEVIGYNRLLNSSEITNIEQYLSNKWAV